MKRAKQRFQKKFRRYQGVHYRPVKRRIPSLAQKMFDLRLFKEAQQREEALRLWRTGKGPFPES